MPVRSVCRQLNQLIGHLRNSFVIFLVLIANGCGLFNEPPPKAYFSLTAQAQEAPGGQLHPHSVQVSVCSDSLSDREVIPVLVMISSRSSTAWTVDAGQISACSSPVGDPNPTCDSPIQLAILPDEAARLAPIPLWEGIGDELAQAGFFATYLAAVGAAGGAFAASAKNEDVSNGFALGASYGAVAGAVVGSFYEFFRLTFAKESQEAGDANEKMKFLALSPRSSIYTGYSAVGYVYFQGRERGDTPTDLTITILFVRGDPSKDWIIPPNYTFTDPTMVDLACASGKCERYKQADESPVVCKCQMKLSSTNTCTLDGKKRMSSTVRTPPPTNNISCTPIDGRQDSGSCSEIHDDFFLGGGGDGLPTSPVWQKRPFE
jgi:hypothetical protein